MSPAAWSDLVEWFSEERRLKPTEQDHHALVRQNLRELAQRVESNRQLSERNAERISRIEHKTDRVLANLEAHTDEAKELLATFKFSRQLRRWVLGILGGVAALGLAATQAHTLWEHLRELFTTRP